MEDEQNNTNQPLTNSFLQLVAEKLASEYPFPESSFTNNFPKTSKVDQRSKFHNQLDVLCNSRLTQVKSTLLKMLDKNHSAYEILLYMNALFENTLRNNFCFHRILHCDDKILKDWLPHFRLDTDSFIRVLEKITKDSEIELDISGKKISLHHATRSKLDKLFLIKKGTNKSSELALDFASARTVRHQIIHGIRIGRTQAHDWGSLTNITEPQCYRACIAIFAMYEAYEDATNAILFKSQGSSFNPFQPDMRGKKEVGARASEHQTKMILNFFGISAPTT